MNTTAWLVLILFFAICLGAGGVVSRLTTDSARHWYPHLRKPPGTPPSRVFGPVWTLLYILMAISAWLVWREYHGGALPALLIFFGQLALNVTWPAIFFRARMPGLALVEIVLLWLAIALNFLVFGALLPVSALLLLPYWLWVSYAVYLNFGIWRLNRSRG